MGCYPSHWLIFFKMVKTTNQLFNGWNRSYHLWLNLNNFGIESQVSLMKRRDVGWFQGLFFSYYVGKFCSRTNVSRAHSHKTMRSTGVNWRLLHSLDLDRVIREGDVDMIQAPAAGSLRPWATFWTVELTTGTTLAMLEMFDWLMLFYAFRECRVCFSVYEVMSISFWRKDLFSCI